MNRPMREELHDIQLQIEMDLESHAILRWVMGSLEIPTYGELIRRSLQAYELFEPKLPYAETEENRDVKTNVRAIKRIHVRLPLRSKERLDRIKEETKSTYTETVNRAVLVLAQLARTKEEVMRGDDKNDGDSTPKADNIHHALAMALL